ncbi:GNAT family N-acetyltransferase [Chryseomicrobium palamuruense]|uniref:GNAT family N-acetyltransferase n=1 Tax=Chryseomicrobium palamuruense TaxID=682973 RepID=A0ABV8UWS3_9BACL
MEVIYRLANLADASALADMRFDFTAEDYNIDASEEARQEFHQTFLAQADDLFGSDRWAIWVAEVEGELVSHIYLQKIDKIVRPERMPYPFYYMTNVYTKPDFRGKGIGGELIEHANAWLTDQRAEFTMVWPSEGGRKFYESHGYKTLNDPMAR